MTPQLSPGANARGAERALSRRQLDVLQKLAAGWLLDSCGDQALQGLLQNRKGEDEKVSCKTINALFFAGLIGRSLDRISDWEITKAGRDALPVNTVDRRQV